MIYKFNPYWSKGRPVKDRWYGIMALYTQIPIGMLDEFRATFPGKFKIRYRGPRFNVPSAARRGYNSKQSTCLKQDATHFSAYYY
jgi:hypothetical protein